MKLLIFLGVLLSVATASAGNESVTIIEKSKDSILSDSSEFHRMNKRFTISTDLLGAGPTRANNYGLSAAYFLNRNTLLLAEAYKGETTGQYHFAFNDDNFKYKGSSVGLYLKKFVGNSFYYRAGLEYRKVDYDYTENSNNYSFSFSGSSLGAAILIGNQWQWENFTLGCDWVGIGLPAVSNIDSEEVSSPLYTGDLHSAQDIYVKAAYIQLLRFYLGYSF